MTDQSEVVTSQRSILSPANLIQVMRQKQSDYSQNYLNDLSLFRWTALQCHDQPSVNM